MKRLIPTLIILFCLLFPLTALAQDGDATPEPDAPDTFEEIQAAIDSGEFTAEEIQALIEQLEEAEVVEPTPTPLPPTATPEPEEDVEAVEEEAEVEAVVAEIEEAVDDGDAEDDDSPQGLSILFLLAGAGGVMAVGMVMVGRDISSNEDEDE